METVAKSCKPLLSLVIYMCFFYCRLTKFSRQLLAPIFVFIYSKLAPNL